MNLKTNSTIVFKRKILACSFAVSVSVFGALAWHLSYSVGGGFQGGCGRAARQTHRPDVGAAAEITMFQKSDA